MGRVRVRTGTGGGVRACPLPVQAGFRAQSGVLAEVPWHRQLWHSLEVFWQAGGDSSVGLVTSVAWWEPVPHRLSPPSAPKTHNAAPQAPARTD